MQRAVAGCAAVSAVAVAAIVGLRGFSPTTPSTSRPAAATIDTGDFEALGRREQGDALSDPFPDAAPPARFGERDSTATSGTGDTLLAEDAEEDVRSP